MPTISRSRRATAVGLVLASVVGAAAVPATSVAAPVKHVGYTIQVKQGALAQGNTVRAKVTVTNPQSSVKGWWSRATIAKVVRKGVNGGYQMPYQSQGYNCTPIVRGNTTSFTCRLRGADVPTTVKLRFKANFA